MGRKSNAKDRPPSEQSIKTSDDTYRKRLRSWKQPRTQLKSKQIPIVSPDNEDLSVPLHKSTIYTYPMKLNPNPYSVPPDTNTRQKESCATGSVFYCPSISDTSVQSITDLNNNHITTLNVDKRKKKQQTSSCESLSGRSSPIKTPVLFPSANDETSTLQLIRSFSFASILE